MTSFLVTHISQSDIKQLILWWKVSKEKCHLVFLHSSGAQLASSQFYLPVVDKQWLRPAFLVSLSTRERLFLKSVVFLWQLRFHRLGTHPVISQSESMVQNLEAICTNISFVKGNLKSRLFPKGAGMSAADREVWCQNRTRQSWKPLSRSQNLIVCEGYTTCLEHVSSSSSPARESVIRYITGRVESKTYLHICERKS